MSAFEPNCRGSEPGDLVSGGVSLSKTFGSILPSTALYIIDADSKGSQEAEQEQAGVGHVKDDKIMGEQRSHSSRHGYT